MTDERKERKFTDDIEAMRIAFEHLHGIEDSGHRSAALFWIVDKLGYKDAAQRILTSKPEVSDAHA